MACSVLFWRQSTREQQVTPWQLGARLSLLLATYAEAWPAAAGSGSAAQGTSSASAATTGPAASDGSDHIVVTALPAEQSSIDRTTYIVRDDAESRSSTVLDILSHVPSVEVTPSGQLRLLGRSGVKILIDGREVANPLAVLGNLQGSQIVKIEVMSNPSAQFSAQGTAGIINVVTGRTGPGGLGGSLTAAAGTLDSFDLKVSPTWSAGGLSLSGSLGLSHSGSRTDFRRDRRRSGSAVAAVIQTEDGTSRFDNTNLTLSLFATYRLSPRETISSTLIGIHGDGLRSEHSRISFGPGTSAVEQAREQVSRLGSEDYSLEYRREGTRKGENYTVSAQRSSTRFAIKDRFAGEFTGPATDAFFSSTSALTRISSLKADLNRPGKGGSVLTAGIALEKRSERSSSLSTGILPSGTPLADEFTQLHGSSTDRTAYLTYQSRILGFTTLPGIRIESRRYELPAALAGAGPGGTHVFPTLHVERRLSRSTHIDVSYSRRITWPDIASLYPIRRFADSTTANVGNIDLRPELTDAYEAKLKTVIERQSLETTAYWRRTENLSSATSEIDEDGVLVSRKINLGVLTARGLNVSLRGPVGTHLSYSATADIAADTIDGDVPDPLYRRSSTRFGLVTQLEYRRGQRDRPGADHITLSYRYTGPIDRGAFYYSGYSAITAAWSRIVSDRLAAVLNLGRVLIPSGTRVTTYAPNVIERQFYRPVGLKAVLSLTYTLQPARQP